MRKYFHLLKEYLLLIFLLLISMFLISVDISPQAAKIKSVFFGTFAVANNLLGNIFVEPLRTSNCEEKSKLAAELNLENERLRTLGLENAELKEMLAYKTESGFSLLTTKIIGKNLAPAKSDLILDKGANDGVQKGMTVISAKGFVGLVINVSDNYSVVRTFENGKMKITGELERNGINGLVTWNGKDLLMKNIPTNYDVKKGDRIVTSPYSLRFARKIPIGLVKEKIESVSGLFSDVIIQPFNDLRTLRYCFVILTSAISENGKIDELLK